MNPAPNATRARCGWACEPAAILRPSTLEAPRAPISDDPTRDSIWKRYLEQLFNRIIPLGTGTVTSVNVSGGTTGLTTSGGPITTSGTITLTGTLAVANGGTGQTSYTNGQLLIGNTTGNTLTKATLTAGTGIVITNGTGTITIAGDLAANASLYYAAVHG